MQTTADLPDDIEELKRRLLAAEAGLLVKTLEAEKLKFELGRLKRVSFGQSSERIDHEIAQLELKLEELEIGEAEAPVPCVVHPAPEEPEAPHKKPLRMTGGARSAPIAANYQIICRAGTKCTNRHRPPARSAARIGLRKVGED